jgi:hypothetical protein
MIIGVIWTCIAMGSLSSGIWGIKLELEDEDCSYGRILNISCVRRPAGMLPRPTAVSWLKRRRDA